MNIVDASIAVKWFVVEPGHAEALDLIRSETKLFAPDLVLVEVANALRRKFKIGELSEVQWREAVDALPLYFDGLIASTGLLATAFEIALRLDHSVYDCLYLAAASIESLIFISADQILIKKCQLSGLGSLIVSIDAWHELHNRVTADDGAVRSVLELYARFERTLDSVRDSVDRPFGSGPFRTMSSEDLKPAFDSPTYVGLRNAIRGMDRRGRAELLALGWLGQGYSGDDWSVILKRAEDYLSDDPDTYIDYLISKIPNIGSGLAKRGALEADPELDGPDKA